MHFNRDSCLIKNYELQEHVSEFTMINPEELLVLHVKSNRILHIHLKSQEQRAVEFTFRQTSCISIFCFSESKLICINQEIVEKNNGYWNTSHKYIHVVTYLEGFTLK